MVIITYTPSFETRTNVVLTVSSPYSSHKVPLMLHSGVATLDFNSTLLDFGMFERTTKPCIPLVITNTGTVKTSYTIKDVKKPSMFMLKGGKGTLFPGKTVEVFITHARHEVEEFKEHLVISGVDDFEGKGLGFDIWLGPPVAHKYNITTTTTTTTTVYYLLLTTSY